MVTKTTHTGQPRLEWGEAVAYLRDERGHEIKALAIAAGVYPSTVEGWINEGRAPTLAVARRLLFGLAASGHRADAELLAQSMLLGSGLQIAPPREPGSADFDGDGDVDADDAIGHLLDSMRKATDCIGVIHEQPESAQTPERAMVAVHLVRDLVTAAGKAAVALHDLSGVEPMPAEPARRNGRVLL